MNPSHTRIPSMSFTVKAVDSTHCGEGGVPFTQPPAHMQDHFPLAFRFFHPQDHMFRTGVSQNDVQSSRRISTDSFKHWHDSQDACAREESCTCAHISACIRACVPWCASAFACTYASRYPETAQDANLTQPSSGEMDVWTSLSTSSSHTRAAASLATQVWNETWQ